MLVRLSSALAAFALTATAGAATISGTVFDDPRAFAVLSEFRPAAGATVMLYRDRGLVTSTTTAENGTYLFSSVADGSYWVAVDSRSVGNREGAWPDQTYGPVGAICDNGVGATTTLV